MTALTIDGLEKRFGAVRVLRDFSLSIGDGELISLLGPSGCGKTTTLRCVAGFEIPDGGRIAFDGEDVTDLPPEGRDIGMVFQNYALFPHITVRENLSFGLEMRRVPRNQAVKRIAHVLDMVQLEPLAERYPRELSGGQQQRVALARALVIEPRVLLLDEPLANLDATLREEMRVFIRELQKRVGITTLYVTHDQAEAMVMSDRVVVMFDGEICQLGLPRDIYARPRNRRVAKFIGRSNFVDGVVERAAACGVFAVATPLGTFHASHDAPLAAGAKVTIAFRPEALLVQADEPIGVPCFSCRIEQTYFMGSSVDHVVRCPDGTTMLVQTAPARGLPAGGGAFVAVPPDGAWIMAEAAR